MWNGRGVGCILFDIHCVLMELGVLIDSTQCIYVDVISLIRDVLDTKVYH